MRASLIVRNLVFCVWNIYLCTASEFLSPSKHMLMHSTIHIFPIKVFLFTNVYFENECSQSKIFLRRTFQLILIIYAFTLSAHLSIFQTCCDAWTKSTKSNSQHMGSWWAWAAQQSDWSPCSLTHSSGHFTRLLRLHLKESQHTTISQTEPGLILQHNIEPICS